MADNQAYADGVVAFDSYYEYLHEQYGRSYPRKTYQAHRFWKTFLRVGERCRENGWDIRNYVHTVLSYCKKDSSSVTPADISGPAKEQVYIEHKDALKVDAAKIWSVNQANLLRLQAASGLTDEEVLSSVRYDGFPAWFRVFYPERLSQAILDEWWQDAVEEMSEHREIVRFVRAIAASRLVEAEKRMGVVDGI